MSELATKLERMRALIAQGVPLAEMQKHLAERERREAWKKISVELEKANDEFSVQASALLGTLESSDLSRLPIGVQMLIESALEARRKRDAARELYMAFIRGGK